MEDHTDDSRYVLTQGKNSSQDWVARGYNFMDNRLYDLAAHCFKVAEDGVRFTVATAFGKYLALKSKKSNLTPTESMQETFKVSKLQAWFSWLSLKLCRAKLPAMTSLTPPHPLLLMSAFAHSYRQSPGLPLPFHTAAPL